MTVYQTDKIGSSFWSANGNTALLDASFSSNTALAVDDEVELLEVASFVTPVLLVAELSGLNNGVDSATVDFYLGDEKVASLSESGTALLSVSPSEVGDTLFKAKIATAATGSPVSIKVALFCQTVEV